MCATKTANIEATVAQVDRLAAAGAGVVRIAADTPQDTVALAEIRRRTQANLAVDLQENYRLAAELAPLVRQDSLQSWPPLPSRSPTALAGQGPLPGRRGRPARLRLARGRELRLGRSGRAREICPGRRDPAHARKRAGPLRAAGPLGVHSLLRVVEGLRSGCGGGGQSAVCPSSGPRCPCTWA